MNKFISSEVLRFLFIGIFNTGVGYLVFSIFYLFTELREVSLIFAYLFGVLFNFKTFGEFVFTSGDKNIFTNFVLIYISLFLLNLILLWFFIDKMSINVYIAQFLSTSIIAPSLFILNKKYVFISISK
ncbi:GtrA family protein [Gammaproteobacteria bacterium]|nr:GtrA family protein [Gammaproteobacteria bacterium]